MKTLLCAVLLFIMSVSCTPMPPCRTKADINPLTESPGIIIGDYKDIVFNVKYILDEQVRNRNYLFIELIAPSSVQTFIEDTIRLTLDNGSEIALINARNYRSREVKMKALVVDMDHHFIRFLAPVSDEAIRQMAINYVSRVRASFKTFDVPGHHESDLPKEHWIYLKKNTYRKVDNHIIFDVGLLSKGNKKAIRYVAMCAVNYLK